MRSTEIPENVGEYCDTHNIDVHKDMSLNPLWTPHLALQRGDKTTSLVQEYDSSYEFTQLNYYDGKKVAASRMIAKITAGQRTEIAYWAKSAPTKVLDVHQGAGKLLTAQHGKDAPLHAERATENDTLHLRAEQFYTLLAGGGADEALVVSGFYRPPADFSALEFYVESPEQTHINTIDGQIEVPHTITAPTIWGAKN